MTSRKTSLTLIAAASLALGGAAFAQQQQPDRSRQDTAGAAGQSGQAGRERQGGQQADPQMQINKILADIAADPKTAADKLFILTATLHNQSELALAKEVMQKTQNEQVKRMAQQMVQSLQQTHDQLQQTARALGLNIPQELAQAAVQEVQIVAALPADQLDQNFTAAVQADNAEDMSQYQSAAQIAQDPQVKRFAQQQLQSIRQRSQEANQTARAMGMPAGGGEAQPAGARIQGDGGTNR
jgi:predicted outer membrane protein